MLPYVIEVDGQFSGQLTIGNVTHGALRSAWIGYWVASSATGGGVATAALALGLDHCFGPVMLHRVEATVRPENAASRAVLAKVGFREEGLLRRYLEVDGAWRKQRIGEGSPGEIKLGHVGGKRVLATVTRLA
jgi:ribosomal-protein-alanine N-acetyltransferase